MKKTFVIIFLASFIIGIGIQVLAENGDRYIIMKDDTLWDISDSELDDSFLWPKLWSVNPHINNPDLIYPGERIRIPTKEELERMMAPALPPQKRMLPMKAMQKPEQKRAKHIFKKRVRVRDKYLIGRDQYISSGWIDPVFPSVGEVITSPTRQEMGGRFDRAYIKVNEGYESVGKFFVIRDAQLVKHPDTGMVLGHHIKIQGQLEVTREKNGIYETTILKSYGDIQAGDGLLPFTAIEAPLIPDAARKPQLGGYIVATNAYVVIAGKDDIIFLDKGENDGLKVGDVFQSYQIRLFERSIGKVQLISLKPTTSGAVIIQSESEIEVGAKFGQD